MFDKIKEVLLDTFFPRFCFSCREEGRYLCEKCTLFLSEASFTCPVCQKAEFSGKTHKSCFTEGAVDGVVGLFEYEGIAKTLICKMKEESLVDIPRELIDYGFLSISENRERFSAFTSFLFDEKTAISYIPIFKKKENLRGFNQQEIAARYLAKITKKEKKTLLKKRKETAPQRGLDKRKRLLNIEDSFSSQNVDVEQVVLVGDVWESGATIKECSKALKRAGVKKVWGFVLTKT